MTEKISPAEETKPIKNDKEGYIQELRHRLAYNPDFLRQDTYNRVFDRLELKGKTVIELGCGFIPMFKGQSYIENLQDRGVNLVPIDGDSFRIKSWTLPESIDERSSESETIIQPLQAAAERLPFPDESIDGGISINLLNEKIRPKIKIILKELHRVLRPGGFILINTFGYLEIIMADGTVAYNDDFPASMVVKAEELKRMITEAGFSQLEDLPLDEEAMNKAVEKDSDSIRDYCINLGLGRPIAASYVEAVAVLARK